MDISTQSCAEVRQRSKVKAARGRFLKRIQVAAKVVVQRPACGPSDHGNVHSHQIPCKGGLSAGVDGFLQFFIGLDAEALHAYNLIAVSVQMIEVVVGSQEPSGNEPVQGCF